VAQRSLRLDPLEMASWDVSRKVERFSDLPCIYPPPILVLPAQEGGLRWHLVR
jgi:hypothetical protein